MAVHLATTRPKGMMNTPVTPESISRLRRGKRQRRLSKRSSSLVYSRFSSVPTTRNRRLFAAAWKMTIITPTHTVAGVPMPAQPTTRPRLAMVDQAKIRLALLSVIATTETNTKVNRPIIATVAPTLDCAMAKDSLSKRNTPAFTMVLEWSKAEVGVGACIAPKSHDEKGIWALLVRPANARSATAGNASALAGPAHNRAKSSPVGDEASSAMATEKPRPPNRFIDRALKAKVMVWGVRV